MKYPIVRQRDLKDCGVACLLMIIEYYGGYVPLNKLRELTHTNKDGVSAYNIKAAAEQIGFKVCGIRTNDLNNIPLPVIAHVVINNFNHYIVIYKINNNEIVIGDPKDGLKKMKLKDFNKIFDNIVLLFKLKKKLPLYKKSISFQKFIINILLKYKKRIIISFFLSMLITLISLFTSFELELISNKNSFLFNFMILFFLLSLFKNILIFVRNKTLFKIQKELESNLTCDIYKKIITLPYEYFKNRTTGEVISRLNDLNILIESILKIILTFFIDILFLLSSLFILLFINLEIFIICFSIIILYFLINLIFSRFILLKIKQLKEDESSLNSYLYESINNFETIKGLTIENSIIKKHNIEKNKLDYHKYKLNNMLNDLNFISNLLKDIGLLLLLFVGAILVLNNILKIEQLFTISLLYLYLISPLESIVELIKNIKESKISYERINDILFDEDSIITKNKLKFKKIKIKKLCFDYYGNKKVLNNIILKLNKKRILILGKSGSGKSTLLKLLKKYYQVPDNKIFIDNIDINKISKKELNEIKYVSQNENLFTDTLYNNILLFRNKKIDKIMNLTSIENRNKIIEENGYNLSGGERQKIIISRSLLDDFKILILDEAFSQMDVNLERKILKRLFKKYHDKKIIVVSHRKNNMDLFDQVVEIENGKVLNNLERR